MLRPGHENLVAMGAVSTIADPDIIGEPGLVSPATYSQTCHLSPVTFHLSPVTCGSVCQQSSMSTVLTPSLPPDHLLTAAIPAEVRDCLFSHEYKLVADAPLYPR